jgi:hypothetical protein
MRHFFLLAAVLICDFHAGAQFAITVSPPKVAGQKAIVSLAMTNGLPEKVESARAVTFLLDDQGKMVGQATKWVIGGEAGSTASPNSGLKSGATNVYHFVITADKPIVSTNLTARVTFTRVILEGSKSVDPGKNVQVHPAPPGK